MLSISCEILPCFIKLFNKSRFPDPLCMPYLAVAWVMDLFIDWWTGDKSLIQGSREDIEACVLNDTQPDSPAKCESVTTKERGKSLRPCQKLSITFIRSSIFLVQCHQSLKSALMHSSLSHRVQPCKVTSSFLSHPYHMFYLHKS